MKLCFLAVAIHGLFLNALSQNPTLKNENDSLSYFIGASIGESLSQSNLSSLSIELLAMGLKDQLNGMCKFNQQEVQMYIQNVLMIREAANSKGSIKAGEDFLAANEKRPGVVKTPSGLQYEVIKMGTGDKPAAEDNVTVHYHGTLIDGAVFDSSVDRGEPASFSLNQVIPGWTEGVQLMNPGSKYKFYIPYSLGYGEQGAGGIIKPYSTLIFEVELISINK
ncbi:MAG: FKBP-type peptidyl-prolyl cis-trans isomerase [Flavobacteriales bacterium]